MENPFHLMGALPIIGNVGAACAGASNAVFAPQYSTEGRAMAEPSTEELPSVEELMQRIADNYESLPRQLKSVATYIEQNRGSVMVDRTSDIAASCGVHPSAVVRFAQRFGFSGFSDLQAVFRQAYTGQGGAAQSYQQRIRKLIDEKPGRLSGGTVAREFVAACRSGLDELEGSLDDEQFEAAVKMLQQAVSRTDSQREEGRCGDRNQLRAVWQGNAVLLARRASSPGENPGDQRQPAIAARPLCERAVVCERGQRVCVPLADQHDLPVPGAVYRACVQAGIERRRIEGPWRIR
jgi:hypothetical protein